MIRKQYIAWILPAIAAGVRMEEVGDLKYGIWKPLTEAGPHVAGQAFPGTITPIEKGHKQPPITVQQAKNIFATITDANGDYNDDYKDHAEDFFVYGEVFVSYSSADGAVSNIKPVWTVSEHAVKGKLHLDNQSQGYIVPDGAEDKVYVQWSLLPSMGGPFATFGSFPSVFYDFPWNDAFEAAPNRGSPRSVPPGVYDVTYKVAQNAASVPFTDGADCMTKQYPVDIRFVNYEKDRQYEGWLRNGPSIEYAWQSAAKHCACIEHPYIINPVEDALHKMGLESIPEDGAIYVSFTMSENFKTATVVGASWATSADQRQGLWVMDTSGKNAWIYDTKWAHKDPDTNLITHEKITVAQETSEDVILKSYFAEQAKGAYYPTYPIQPNQPKGYQVLEVEYRLIQSAPTVYNNDKSGINTDNSATSYAVDITIKSPVVDQQPQTGVWICNDDDLGSGRLLINVEGDSKLHLLDDALPVADSKMITCDVMKFDGWENSVYVSFNRAADGVVSGITPFWSYSPKIQGKMMYAIPRIPGLPEDDKDKAVAIVVDEGDEKYHGTYQINWSAEAVDLFTSTLPQSLFPTNKSTGFVFADDDRGPTHTAYDHLNDDVNPDSATYYDVEFMIVVNAPQLSWPVTMKDIERGFAFLPYAVDIQVIGDAKQNE